MRRVDVIIYGRVQGVLFRYNAKKIADRLGVKGCVRNNPDDSVEIVAEGKEEDIEKILNWCRKGPVGAKVDRVYVKDREFKNEFRSFSVIY